LIPDVLITTYLEITDPTQFKPVFVDHPDFDIIEMTQPDVEFYLFLYRSVGEKWRWFDRLKYSHEQMNAILYNRNVNIYVIYQGGVPGGYIELEQDGDSTEVAYFGLREGFIGRGLGKHLLSFGVQRAFENGARRVWLHTCNLDSPHALANYQKRGFTVYDVREQPMPDTYRI